MASRLVGSVHFNSTIDGKGMPADAKRIGEESGRAASEGYDKEWRKSHRDSLTRTGRESLARFRASGRDDSSVYAREWKARWAEMVSNAEKAFAGMRIDKGFLDNLARDFGSTSEAANEMRTSMNLLREEGLITNRQFEAGRVQLDGWADAQRRAAQATDEAAAASKRITDEEVRRTRSLAELEEHLGRISAGYKKWDQHYRTVNSLGDSVDHYGDRLRAADVEHRTFLSRLKSLQAINPFSKLDNDVQLVVGLIAAAADQIATLGSAVGAGAIGLGGAFSSVLVGGYGVGAMFARLTKDIDEVPPAMRGVVSQFKEFGAEYSRLNDVVAQAAFDQMPDTFSKFSGTLRALQPYLAAIGTTVGRLTDDLSTKLQPGTQEFKALSTLIRNAGPNFDSLSRSAGTLAVGLFEAFNGAQPLVEQLTGWISRLASQFRTFVNGPSFDEWIGNSMQVWSSFGGLLDSVGRALNDLVYPETVARTTALLDNLSAFIPVLGGILDVIGTLDPLGLVAQVLAEVGSAIEPLLPSLKELAGTLNQELAIALSAVAELLGVAVDLVTPFVQAAASLLSALPPGSITAITVAIGGLIVSLRLLKAASAADALSATSMGMTALSGAALRTNAALGVTQRAMGLLSKAGVAGIAITAVLGLSDALEDLQRKVTGIEERAKNAVTSGKSLSSAYDDLGKSAFGMSYELTNASGALDMLGSVGTGIEDFFPTLAATFSDTGRQASQLATTLAEMDAPLAQMASTSLPDAVAKFQNYANELGATKDQQLLMLEQMPQLKAAFEGAAAGADGLATKQELLALITDTGTSASERNAAGLAATATQAGLTKTQIDTLSAAIRGFGSEALTSRDAERQFQAAMDDLTASVAANGGTLDINTEQGRANQAALDQIASSSIAAADAKLKLSGDENQATEAIQRGRDALILQLGQFGITGQAAEDYANELGLIPGNVSTSTQLLTDESKVQYWKRLLGSIPSFVTTTADVYLKRGNLPATAVGGTFNGAQARVIAEAGPEAVVPLDRPLSQVDQSVRWLSAIAQGKMAPGTSGSNGGSSKVVTFTEGAIVVQGYFDPRQAAIDVGDEVAERVSS